MRETLGVFEPLENGEKIENFQIRIDGGRGK